MNNNDATMCEQSELHPGTTPGLVARLEFETLLADISAKLIGVPSEDLEHEIIDAQRRLCAYLGVDRSVLWQASETDPRVVLMTHVYPPPEVAVPDNPNSHELFPWAARLVEAGEHLAITSLSTLPPEAAHDRETWERYSTKSSLIFPLVAGGPVFGALTFAALQRERDWPEEIVTRCRVLAQVFANVLTRKRLERALRESEQRYRSIAMNLPGMIYQFCARDDGVWSIGYVDSRASEICGLSPEPLETFFDRFAACVAPECRDRWLSSIREAIEGCRGWEYDVRFIKPDGQEVYLRGFSQPERRNDTLVFSGVMRDISVQKRAEIALRQSQATLSAIIDSTSDMIWSVDPVTFGLLTFNVGLREYFLKRHDLHILPGMPPERLLPPGFAEKWNEFYRKALRDGPYTVEYVVSAGINILQLSFSPMQQDGTVLGVAVFGKDVTERKRAENLLRDSEERFRQVAEVANDFIWEVNAEGLYTYTSPSVQKILGYAPEELVGKRHFYDSFVPEAREELKSKALATFAARQSFRGFPNINLSKDGKRVHLETSGIPLLDSAGRLLGYRGADMDVTARRRAEEELRLTVEELNRLKEQLQHENVYLRNEVQALQGQTPVVGNSELIRKVLAQAQQVAATGSTVLILGETGTGKELLAHHLHRIGKRSAKPFITTNIAAIPGTLLESELFGREKGAYTGALNKQIGRFEMADGGTLFLDEIGEMPLEFQAKLLRVLQEGEFERLGSGQTHRVNVQVIAATNRKLPELIREGKFRHDLYYRLHVFPITLPPLRDRPEDIPLLVWSFIQEFSERMGKPVDRIHKKDLAALQNYDWPGNVRELRNVVERSMILAHGPELRLNLPDTEPRQMASESRLLRDVERSHIEDVLRSTGGRIRGPRGAAEILGLKAPTLYAMMERLGVPRGK